MVLGSGGELEPVLEAEQLVEVGGEVDAAVHLFFDLLACAKEVRVVLGDVAHSGEAVEGPGELVAMKRRSLGETQRELAVAPQPVSVHAHVPRAVHRLERVDPVAVRDLEHVLPELLPMAGGLPEPLVVDQRRLHLDVAALRVLAAAEVLEDVPDHHPLRVPEGRAGRDVLEVEEIELPAEHTVVSGPRLLDPGEVRRQVVRRVEGRAVDPGQLRVLLVAAPVRTREPGELDRLDRLRILQMRAAAEIGEVALRVQRDVPFRTVDELDLVRLVFGLEARPGLLPRDLLARPRPPLPQLLADLGLDPLEVGLVDRLGELEVVVEAVLDRRPDRELHARVQAPHRLG